jgi:hypothetical protein
MEAGRARPAEREGTGAEANACAGLRGVRCAAATEEATPAEENPMSDNPKKRKADGKRVALKQDHERDYLLRELEGTSLALDVAKKRLDRAIFRLYRGSGKGRR